MDTRARIVAGVAGLLIAAAVDPSIVGALLMLFSVLVLIFAVIGAVWPSVLKLPNRLASVWVFTLAVGMFLGGGMLISPPNGHGTASDAPASERVRRPIESPARDRHIREMERAAEARRRMAARRSAPSGPSGPDPETDPCGYVDQNYNRMSPAERNRMLQACGNVVRGSGRSGPEV
ncbi:MAG: hypothetical protein OXQ29_05270, partial [Rhodospirillaceae bacterium]|nr:hypothetical protein [Rhodospirillaceae bacterium]